MFSKYLVIVCDYGVCFVRVCYVLFFWKYFLGDLMGDGEYYLFYDFYFYKVL